MHDYNLKNDMILGALKIQKKKFNLESYITFKTKQVYYWIVQQPIYEEGTNIILLPISYLVPFWCFHESKCPHCAPSAGVW